MKNPQKFTWATISEASVRTQMSGEEACIGPSERLASRYLMLSWGPQRPHMAKSMGPIQLGTRANDMLPF